MSFPMVPATFLSVGSNALDILKGLKCKIVDESLLQVLIWMNFWWLSSLAVVTYLCCAIYFNVNFHLCEMQQFLLTAPKKLQDFWRSSMVSWVIFCHMSDEIRSSFNTSYILSCSLMYISYYAEEGVTVYQNFQLYGLSRLQWSIDEVWPLTVYGIAWRKMLWAQFQHFLHVTIKFFQLLWTCMDKNRTLTWIFKTAKIDDQMAQHTIMEVAFVWHLNVFFSILNLV